nr:hypothetical protein [Flavisolibacter tropicus]
MERKLDPFGTLIIAFTTAIGGERCAMYW